MSSSFITATKQFSRHIWDAQCSKVARQHHGTPDFNHSTTTINHHGHSVASSSVPTLDHSCCDHETRRPATRRNSASASGQRTRPFLHSQHNQGFFSSSYNVSIMRSFCRSFGTVKQPLRSAFPAKPTSYYDDLEVPVTATKLEIRRAFLRLAKRYHPDTAVSGEGVGNEFQKIQLAYDVLSDDVKRREYDWRSRGIWRHSPSGIDPLDQNSEFQQQRREFWRQWEERKRNAAREEGEEERGEDDPIAPRRFRYTEAELAEMEAAERASRLEYQQRMTARLREIGKKREAMRRESYRAAQARYAANIESREDDDLEKPTRSAFAQHLIQSLRRCLGSLFIRHRFVTVMGACSAMVTL